MKEESDCCYLFNGVWSSQPCWSIQCIRDWKWESLSCAQFRFSEIHAHWKVSSSLPVFPSNTLPCCCSLSWLLGHRSWKSPAVSESEIKFKLKIIFNCNENVSGKFFCVYFAKLAVKFFFVRFQVKHFPLTKYYRACLPIKLLVSLNTPSKWNCLTLSFPYPS
jgi:hypothetical protein